MIGICLISQTAFAVWIGVCSDIGFLPSLWKECLVTAIRCLQSLVRRHIFESLFKKP